MYIIIFLIYFKFINKELKINEKIQNLKKIVIKYIQNFQNFVMLLTYIISNQISRLILQLFTT